ncbi:MAG TPA: S8 family serine peptidase [Pyrinomonadaceae bacterium]|jgi:subtilisin family serine protease|nr:S8 family serine peptidase [Pyrinomonadaceae bacterium]
MSRIFLLKALVVLLSLGLFTYFLTRSDEQVSHAQSGFDRTQYANDRPVGELQAQDDLPQTGEFNVMIELNDLPSAKVYAETLGNKSDKAANPQERSAAQSAARAQHARIKGAQQRVLARLASFGRNARVLYTVQTAYNGIAARVDASVVPQLRNNADVKGVYALPIHTIDNSSSVPFIKAASAWSATSGASGDGVRIAVIDTGVDYLHANFGGPGTAAAFTANNRNIIEPGTFPTAKVVGGLDFAGDAYTGANAPIPDPDPLDCNGHGSHVAGTATGFGVNGDGTTFLGPWDGSTPFSSFTIGPGVAPRAQLYALKVFGCSGSTGLTTQAINWAVDPNGDGDPSDHVDVINMSLGSNFGTANDASAAASSNAVLAGVIVVTSAGNSGDTHFITSSPGTSTRAISVANIVDWGNQTATTTVNSPAAIAGNKSSLPGTFNPLLTTATQITGNIRLGNDGSTDPFPGTVTPGTTTDACQPFAPGFFTGLIALVDRGGGCGFTFKVKNAQNAGATAVIVANNAAGTISMGGIDPTITIMSLSITQTDGNAIKAQLGTGVNATLTFNHLGDTVSASTSRGGRRDDLGVKPDIAAPGTNIISTGFGTGNLSAPNTGTSMASPHVTGTMALLRQLHPTWSVEELKALVMNTANHDLFTGTNGTGSKFAGARIGAGRVDVQDASSAEVIAYSDDGSGSVSVSFGSPEVVGTANLTKTARVANKGSVDVSYDLSYVALSDVPGVTYSFPDGPNITVPAGGSTTFTIELSANAAAMKHVRDATMATTQANNARFFMSEESGYVTLTPTSGTSLRLPVYAAPRPASDMTTDHNYVLLTAPTGSTNVGLTGQDVLTGNGPPLDELSVVSAFELQGTSPANIPATSLASNADLKSVGVTSDFKATNSVVAGSTRIFFGITMHGKWATLSDLQVNIFIDRDRNGTDDFQIVNTAFADTQGNNFDVFISARRPAPFTAGFTADSFINNVSPASIDTVVYNTNMMIIPVTASSIGLTTANAKFNYRVVTTSRGFGGTIDTLSTRTYDAANPGFDVTNGVAGLPLYLDLNGGSVPVVYNKANLTANGTLGLLLLHHHNAAGDHDQTLSLQEPTATTVTVDAASGVYSDATTLTATVSPATYLDQTISGNVQFSIDGNTVGAAVAVNSSGVATTSYTIDVGAGAHTITAAFTSTNAAFLNGSNTGTLTVSKEDADVSPAAVNPFAVKVNAPGGTGGPVTLCFDMTEVSDSSPGDTTKITSVTVTVTPIGTGSAVSAGVPVLSGGGVGATRTACVTLNNVPVNVYDVTLTINGNFYQGSGSTVLTIYDPSLGFVAGGGQLVHNGYRATVGVNMKYLKSGNAQGSLLYIEHRPTGDVKVKSTALGTMAIVGGEAIPTGKATVNGVGNHSFIARVIDNGDPGYADRFGLRLTNPSGVIVVDLTFDSIQLSGGNFSVPKLTGK